MTFSDYSWSRKLFQGHYLANGAPDRDSVRCFIKAATHTSELVGN